MDESEDNLSSEDMKSTKNTVNVKTKPKKRSLIERELETSLTARITSPATDGDGTNTSRYGRARRHKSNTDQSDVKKVTSQLKSPLSEKPPTAPSQSPVYKMHASNSPIKLTGSTSLKLSGSTPVKVTGSTPMRMTGSPKEAEKYLDNQIESIYQENISLSRFKEDNAATPSPIKKFPKVYIRKDLIQRKEPEDTVTVIQNMFSPVRSARKTSNTHLNNILERSCEKYSLSSKQQNGFIDNSSVVKTLDFDGKNKKKDVKDKAVLSKSEVFELEARCPYQVGDLAWARMGTYPFWPSIVTRDPSTGTFVKKKLFGRIERDVIHVTFFGDNGRRSWIVDNMLRKYHGQLEFESTRKNFSPEDKKKDPRLYAAYFISEKKQALWSTSVEEAEMLLREPKRLRIDIFNEMLLKSRSSKVKQPKSKISRTNSDVSLSESLYDSLFSEEDGKSDIGRSDRLRNRSKNKSLDMFEVVTACLDNMAAKTGITKIQKQSHMDRWLQKAKSKTPEKTKTQVQAPLQNVDEKKNSNTSKKKITPPKNAAHKNYSLRKKAGREKLSSQQNELIIIQDDNIGKASGHILTDSDGKQLFTQETDELGVIIKVESLAGNTGGKIVSATNCSTDMNATCESETFTDESNDSSNVISTDCKNITESEFIPIKLDDDVFNQDNVCEDLVLESKINDSHGSKIVTECNEDVNLCVKNNVNQNSSKEKNPNKHLNLESQSNCSINSVIDNQSSENSIDFHDNDTQMVQDSKNSTDSTKSDDSQEPQIDCGSEKNIDLNKSSPSQGSQSDLHSADNADLRKNDSQIDSSSENSTDLRKPDDNQHTQIHLNSETSRDLSKPNDNQDLQISQGSRNSKDFMKPYDNQTSQVHRGNENSIDSEQCGNNQDLNIDQSSEGIADLKKLDNYQDSQIENSDDLRKSLNDQNIKTQHDIHLTNLKNEQDTKVIPTIRSQDVLNSQNTSSILNIYSEKFDNIEMRKHSNVMSILADDSIGAERIDINPSNKDTQKHHLNTDNHNVSCYNTEDMLNNKEDKQNTKFKTLENQLIDIVVTPEHNVNRVISENDGNESDDMYTDEDSDSERLPYSPLSNLGNNSDDNLSLDDVPYVADDFTELKTQNIDTANKTILDDSMQKNWDNNISEISKENLHVVLESKKYGTLEIVSDKLMAIESGLTAGIGKNKYCDFKISSKNKNEVTENQSNEVVHLPQNNVKSFDKETYLRDENAKDSIQDITTSGYKGKNIREIDMVSKEVRIYVSKENGFHNMNGDCDVKSISTCTGHNSLSNNVADYSKQIFHSKNDKNQKCMDSPDFVKYMELRKDAILDENPELSEKEIVAYLHKTWLYEASAKLDVMKTDNFRERNIVKGLNQLSSKSPSYRKNLSLSRKNQTSKIESGNLKMFLRRKKDEDKEQDRDELRSKRGKKKHCVRYDEDDSHEDDAVGKGEWQVMPLNEHKSISLLALDTAKTKEIEETKSLLHEDIQESASGESNNSNIKQNVNVSIELKESVVKQSKTSNSKSDINMIMKGPNNFTEYTDVIKETATAIKENNKFKNDLECDSVDSEDSEAPLIKCKLRSKAKKENCVLETGVDKKRNDEDCDTLSINSVDSEMSNSKNKKKMNIKNKGNTMHDPEFIKYLDFKKDGLIDENPDLTEDEIVAYLYQTWLYKENMKSDVKKNDDIEQSAMVKGLTDAVQPPKKLRRKIPKTEKTDKDVTVIEDDSPNKDKPKRKSVKPFYNEEYSDIEDELEVYEIFKPRPKAIKVEGQPVIETEQLPSEVEIYDEVELYFAELTKPKPNIFKGLVREKVCEICEKVGNLIKCKGCHCMFHVDCVKKQKEVVEISVPSRGRKKKKRQGRKPKNSEEFDFEQDLSEENNASIEEITETESIKVDADTLEAQLSTKMKEILDSVEKIEYDSYSSDECLDWNETVPGKCEIVDVKLKSRLSRREIDYSDFKCNNCQIYNTPVCFVCKLAVSSKGSSKRQKCHIAHCHKYYHLECLDHWPQTQFNGGEPSKNNKKFTEHFEAITCPRHVCHTCVSDDPRGCKTRFSTDKLARCLKCPATYHSFTKCLPAGSQILTASHIMCPRHYEQRAGKAPCHVNTGWCFICAQGGSLICCEYCPTSFHAECLNIDPPEGGYMCEDCETGRLPLYGEMVWVKLGHYRWWPGIILHPYEIPENLLAVKHSPGEFVVRFFGQYDHYWVNRGRVFPFQEGDSGRISSQKSKIDAAFTTAVEHAQRAWEILKSAQPNEEESLDIASSLLPPRYVKLKVNKPCGSLCGRKLEDPESSLTQCECNPHEEDPCGPYSQCLNRMLLTECGPQCRAGDRCNNRAFEKRLYPKLVPYRTPSRGWGLKTLEDIKAGQFVIEYVGELIDEEEFRRRMRRKHEMRDENFYFLTLDKERMIDAGPKGNLARFMNHCCEPNCETQKWTVLGDVRVGLFALYDIPAHSEVTFNYNLECAGIDKKRCMCGAKRCSGYIGAKPKQEESQVKKTKTTPGKRTYKKSKPEESPSTKSKAKRPIGRPRKPRELTEIEKDLLIIRNATNSMSTNDNHSFNSESETISKDLKRKRVSSAEEAIHDVTESPNVKKPKLEVQLEKD